MSQPTSEQIADHARDAVKRLKEKFPTLVLQPSQELFAVAAFIQGAQWLLEVAAEKKEVATDAH